MRHVSEILPGVMADLGASFAPNSHSQTRLKAFVVEGDRILHRSTRRWLTIEQARAMIPVEADQAITADAPFDEYHEGLLLDLVRAIREAEGHSPEPPVAMARAA